MLRTAPHPIQLILIQRLVSPAGLVLPALFVPFVLPVIFAVLLCLCTLGCTTVVQPIGPWGRPADLHLRENSLHGISTDVRCGVLSVPGAPARERALPVCQHIRHALEEIGATEPTQGTAPDFTLWYLEKGKGSISCSWPVQAAFYLSIGWYPCASVEWSEAEFQVLDRRGVVLETSSMRVESTTVVGWPVLFSKAFRLPPPTGEIKHRLLRYAQNRIVSQAVRMNADRMNTDREE